MNSLKERRIEDAKNYTLTVVVCSYTVVSYDYNVYTSRLCFSTSQPYNNGWSTRNPA